jgi:hypothetical protein
LTSVKTTKEPIVAMHLNKRRTNDIDSKFKPNKG